MKWYGPTQLFRWLWIQTVLKEKKNLDLVLVTDGSEVTPVGHHYDNSRGINESRLKRRYLGSDSSLILVWFRFGLWF